MKEIKKLGIAGAGGIGGFVVQNLLNYGVDRDQFPLIKWQVDLFDDDKVDTKNLLHQNFTPDDVGKFKSKVFEERSAGLITAHNRFMTKDDFKNYDVIFSCVDSSSFRRDLYNFWLGDEDKGELKFWVDGRCNSRQIVHMNSDVSKDTLKRFISEEDVRASCLLQFEKDNNISHVTPSIIAGISVQCFMNWLRGETTKERILIV